MLCRRVVQRFDVHIESELTLSKVVDTLSITAISIFTPTTEKRLSASRVLPFILRSSHVTATGFAKTSAMLRQM